MSQLVAPVLVPYVASHSMKIPMRCWPELLLLLVTRGERGAGRASIPLHRTRTGTVLPGSVVVGGYIWLYLIISYTYCTMMYV